MGIDCRLNGHVNGIKFANGDYLLLSTLYAYGEGWRFRDILRFGCLELLAFASHMS